MDIENQKSKILPLIFLISSLIIFLNLDSILAADNISFLETFPEDFLQDFFWTSQNNEHNCYTIILAKFGGLPVWT